MLPTSTVDDSRMPSLVWGREAVPECVSPPGRGLVGSGDGYDCPLIPAPLSALVGPPVRVRVAGEPPLEISKLAVLGMVVRRGGPKLLEASVIPGALFYVCLVWGALGLAYLSAIVWTFGCLAHRLVRRRDVPTVLILGAIGLSIRTAVAVGSGSQFVYFVQPILGTVVMGGVFLVSIALGRPMIGRLATDFWPVTPEQAANPRVRSLFRWLTVLWAGVNLATASLTFALLVWLPVETYVAVKQVSGLGITASAIAITIVWSHRTACSEGMVKATPRRRDARALALAAAPVVP